MELTSYTDYSLRLLIYLGVRRKVRCQVADIARTYGISRNHLAKVAHRLALGGFVHSYRGRGGGLSLAVEPSRIRIGDVVRYAEGPIQPVECFRAANRCLITRACVLATILSKAVDKFFDTLDQYTLADLVAESRPLEALFAERVRPGPRVRTGLRALRA